MPTDFWPALSSRTGRYLLTRALWMSFVITLVMFSYILFSEFDRGRQQIHHDLQQIENSYQSSLSLSLWNFDANQVQIQLQGILNFPGVRHVQIESRDLGLLQAGERPLQPDESFRFTLSYRDKDLDIELGTVTVQASYQELYTQLKDIALRILLVQLLKTLTISLLLLSLIHGLITRHLVSLANWARQFGLDTLDNLPDIGRRVEVADELSTLVQAISRMQTDLRNDIRRREIAEQEVRDTRNHLGIAIENSSMGFGRYNASTNQLEANNHLCQQLRISREELQSRPSPFHALVERIEGSAGIEQRERINQLLQGRVQRIHGEVILRKFNDQLGVFDITIQTVSYADNRPREILICSIDKSREQQAILQVQDLSVTLESRISRSTETLQHDLQIIRAAYERLKRDYERLKISHTDNNRYQFLQFLADALAHEQSIQPDYAGRCRLACTRQALELLASQHHSDFDLAAQIHDWYQHNHEQFLDCKLKLPYSLVLASTPALFTFLLNWLTHEQLLGHSRASTRVQIGLGLQGPRLLMSVELENPALHPSNRNANAEHLLQLSQHLVSLKTRGTLSCSSGHGKWSLQIDMHLEELSA